MASGRLVLVATPIGNLERPEPPGRRGAGRRPTWSRARTPAARVGSWPPPGSGTAASWPCTTTTRPGRWRRSWPGCGPGRWWPWSPTPACPASPTRASAWCRAAAEDGLEVTWSPALRPRWPPSRSAACPPAASPSRGSCPAGARAGRAPRRAPHRAPHHGALRGAPPAGPHPGRPGRRPRPRPPRRDRAGADQAPRGDVAGHAGRGPGPHRGGRAPRASTCSSSRAARPPAAAADDELSAALADRAGGRRSPPATPWPRWRPPSPCPGAGCTPSPPAAADAAPRSLVLSLPLL